MALLVVAGMLGAATAEAGAVYATSAEATLTIDGFAATPGTGFTISGTAEPVADAPDYDTFSALLFTGNDLSGAFATGDATAGKSASAEVDAADPDDMGINEGLHQSASVNGSAGTPHAYSVALQMTTGVLTFDNASGADVTVNLAVDYLWAVSANVGNLLTEFAESFFNIWAAFYLDGEWVADLLVVGDDPEQSQFVQTWLDGNLTSSNAGSESFDVTVPTGHVGEVALFVDAEGYAETIPEPTGLALFGFGLVLAGIRMARRRPSRT